VFTGGEGYREDHHAYRRAAQSLATASGAAVIVSVKRSLRGAELPMIRPAAIVMGSAVFMIGVLSGAGIAVAASLSDVRRAGYGSVDMKFDLTFALFQGN
jgi:hypothetical protein